MKRGGQVIYAGELGTRSQKIIDYFQVRRWILCFYNIRSFSDIQSLNAHLARQKLFLYDTDIDVGHYW